VTVEDFDLRHGLDDLKTIVRLFSKWVSKQIELLQEGKPRQEFEEDVQVAQLVITDQQYLKEFESFDAFNIRKLVVLAVDFLDAEVTRNIVQSL